MLPDPKVKCPHTGFSKSCRSIVAKHDCPKFVKISGVSPNDGQQIDKFGCIDSFLHMLLIENSQQQRQTGAAVESFRNEMVRANNAGLALMLQQGGPRQEREMIGQGTMPTESIQRISRP